MSTSGESTSYTHFSLYKRSNGIYYIGYYSEGRRRWKSTGVTTKQEALKQLTQFKELLTEQPHSVRFEQFKNDFLAYAATNLSQNTVRMYKTIFRIFGTFVRNNFLNEITPQAIDKYKVKRLREISPVSVNIELRMLKAAFGTAKRWNLVRRNPFNDVPFLRIPEQVPLSLTHEEFQKFISMIRESWFKELVIFAVLTGMRRGEILNLRWQDVNLAGRVLLIQSNENFITKHGKKRIVPLSDLAVTILESKLKKQTNEYVFTLNDKKISGGWVTHLFKRYVRESKLSNPKFRFHSLRHTFCTWLVESGVPLAHVQQIVGHSSITVTEGYSHLTANNLQTAVNKISISLN